MLNKRVSGYNSMAILDGPASVKRTALLRLSVGAKVRFSTHKGRQGIGVVRGTSNEEFLRHAPLEMHWKDKHGSLHIERFHPSEFVYAEYIGHVVLS